MKLSSGFGAVWVCRTEKFVEVGEVEPKVKKKQTNPKQNKRTSDRHWWNTSDFYRGFLRCADSCCFVDKCQLEMKKSEM